MVRGGRIEFLADKKARPLTDRWRFTKTHWQETWIVRISAMDPDVNWFGLLHSLFTTSWQGVTYVRMYHLQSLLTKCSTECRNDMWMYIVFWILWTKSIQILWPLDHYMQRRVSGSGRWYQGSEVSSKQLLGNSKLQESCTIKPMLNVPATTSIHESIRRANIFVNCYSPVRSKVWR